MMPLAVMILGIAGAFTTTSMASADDAVLTQGYYFVSALDRCHIGPTCLNNGGPVCKMSDEITQLWGKTEGTPDCPVILYKN